MDEKKNELLPCPFCGAHKTYETSNGYDSFYVECGECGASGPVFDTEPAAVSAWEDRKTGQPVGYVEVEHLNLLVSGPSKVGNYVRLYAVPFGDHRPTTPVFAQQPAQPYGRERQEIRNALMDALNNLPADGECAKLVRDTLDRMGRYAPPATLAYGLFFEENEHRVLQYPVRSTAEECERDKALYEPVWRGKLHVHRLVDGGAVVGQQPTGKTLLGLPVVIDDTVPPGTAEFRSGRRAVQVNVEVKPDQDAAVAAIQFALEDECGDGLQFLRYWNEGEFDVIRRNWADVPEAVFIGADPLYVPKK
jgi:Lar family restriction alleviation protein